MSDLNDVHDTISTTAVHASAVEGGRGKQAPSPSVQQGQQRQRQDIENVAGSPLSAEYSCCYNNLNGTLYAGSKSLYFEAYDDISFNFFGLGGGDKKKLELPWDNIRRIHKVDSVSVSERGSLSEQSSSPSPATVLVQVECNDDSVHEFANIHAPERAWAVLVSLHNDTLLEELLDGSSTPKKTSPYYSFKRRNSDPSLLSSVSIKNKEPYASLEESSSRDDDFTTPEKSNDSSIDAAVADPATTGSGVAIPLSEIECRVGKLSLQPIHCTCQTYPGKLYAGMEGMYFCGEKMTINNLLFWWDKSPDQKAVLLTWDRVRSVQVAGGNGIRVLTTKSTSSQSKGETGVEKEDRGFVFEDMEAPDRVWASLVSLHNQNLTESSRPLKRGRRRRHRRMNSDPNMTASSPNLLSTVMDDDSQEDRGGRSDRDGDADAITAQTTLSSAKSPLDEPAATTAAPLSVQDQWKQVVEDSDKLHDGEKKVVIADHELTCDLDTYVDTFLCNNAPKSMATFLQEDGESNVDESMWEEVDSDCDAAAEEKITTMKRVIHYTHPVNNPLAPPTARARKEQRFRRYANYGLVVETKTFVDDIPMADCFYVFDRVIVQVIEDDSSSGGKKVSVTLEFSITFVKSTIFRGIISKQTSSALVAGLQAFASFLSQGLGGEIAPVSAESVPAGVETEMAGKTRSNLLGTITSNRTAILLTFVIVLQLWMILELRDLRAAVRSLHKEQCPS